MGDTVPQVPRLGTVQNARVVRSLPNRVRPKGQSACTFDCLRSRQRGVRTSPRSRRLPEVDVDGATL